MVDGIGGNFDLGEPLLAGCDVGGIVVVLRMRAGGHLICAVACSTLVDCV